MNRKYKTFYPGMYTDKEKQLLDAAQAYLDSMPVGSVQYEHEVTEEQAKEYARLWDPFNPLFSDPEYAVRTKWGRIPCMTFAPYPMFGTYFTALDEFTGELGDLFYYGNDGGDMYFYKPVFTGDRLTSKRGLHTYTDDTAPEGETYRRLTFKGEDKIFNQDGELVAAGYGQGRNAVRVFEDDGPVPSDYEQTFEWVNYIPPVHITTDEEWVQVKAMWKNEYIRGADTLYWDDVNIGDMPVQVCSGPISNMDLIRQHGASLISMPSIREMFGTPMEGMLFKDSFGQYVNFVARHYTDCNMPGARAVFYNFTARNYIVRMISNWMSDDGFISHIGWRFQNLFECMAGNEPGKEDFEKVPEMKGKYVNRHGMEGDTAICKGYVTDKYERDGKYYAGLVCWAETFDGEIIQSVTADVELPKR